MKPGIFSMDRLRGVLPSRVSDYFRKGHRRSIRIKRNILFSFVLRGFNILINLMLVPLTINYINPTQYGIWITLSSIVAWFSFFDIGLGHGLRNKFSEAVARGKHRLARIYVSSTYAVLSIVSLAAILVFLLINPLLNWPRILNTSPEMYRELSVVAMLVFVFFCIQFVLQLVNVVLTANQEPAKAALFKFYSNLLALAAIFVLSKITSGNLMKLGAALSVAPLIALLAASLWFYSSSYKRYSPAPAYVRFKVVPGLMSLGVKFFIIQVSGIVIFSTDNVIISQLFGPQEVTPYSLAFKYFSTTAIIYSIIISPFWSAITEAYTHNDISWMHRSMSAMLKCALALILLILLMTVFSPFIYRLWVGDSVHIPLSLSVLMAIYFSITLFIQPYTYFINGTGKVKVQLVQSLAMAVLNIPLAIFLGSIPALGLNGVVLAIIICTIPGLILGPLQYRMLIKKTATGIWNR